MQGKAWTLDKKDGARTLAQQPVSHYITQPIAVVVYIHLSQCCIVTWCILYQVVVAASFPRQLHIISIETHSLVPLFCCCKLLQFSQLATFITKFTISEMTIYFFLFIALAQRGAFLFMIISSWSFHSIRSSYILRTSHGTFPLRYFLQKCIAQRDNIETTSKLLFEFPIYVSRCFRNVIQLLLDSFH